MDKMKLILQRPVLSEKSTDLQTKQNQYTFIVARDANKIEIRKAVESKFGVNVESVNSMNYLGKLKRVGRFIGRKNAYKKAVVTVKEGEKIEFFDE
ncbi:MAG: 50S ribosomal protein L23 [Candidatus Cloacimonadota bacterium]|nr:MAG: 50S ribosomal protein L23 [Candidatus Cloacimonadota bacterium]PIE79122.1 MAG: 50S ribosomal protein L23 [Candidatus Delongbacteria bacterium]